MGLGNIAVDMSEIRRTRQRDAGLASYSEWQREFNKELETMDPGAWSTAFDNGHDKRAEAILKATTHKGARDDLEQTLALMRDGEGVKIDAASYKRMAQGIRAQIPLQEKMYVQEMIGASEKERPGVKNRYKDTLAGYEGNGYIRPGEAEAYMADWDRILAVEDQKQLEQGAFESIQKTIEARSRERWEWSVTGAGLPGHLPRMERELKQPDPVSESEIIEWASELPLDTEAQERVKRRAVGYATALEADRQQESEAKILEADKEYQKALYTPGVDIVEIRQKVLGDERYSSADGEKARTARLSSIDTIAEKVAKGKVWTQAQKNDAEARARRALAAQDFATFDTIMQDEADNSLDALKKAKIGGDRARNVQFIADVEKQHNDYELQLHRDLDALGADATAQQENDVVDAIIDQAAESAAKDALTFTSAMQWVWRNISSPRPGSLGFRPPQFKGTQKTTYQDLVEGGLALPKVTGPDDPVFQALAPGEEAYDVELDKRIRKQ
jgi:hypothetical protein